RLPRRRIDVPDDARPRVEDRDHLLAVREEGPPPTRVGTEERRTDELSRCEIPEPELPVAARCDLLGAVRVVGDAQHEAVLASKRPSDLPPGRRVPEVDVA